MSTRDYGTGSLNQVGPDRWQLRWYTAPDPMTGRRSRRSMTVHGTKRDAARRLATLASSTRVDAHTITLATTIARWREAATHAPGTAAEYTRAAATIPARLADMPIAKITAPALTAVIDHVEHEHGIHRARKVHAVTSGALTYAWRQEWIADNPARRVQPPAQPRRTGTEPTAAQVRQLLDQAAKDLQMYAWLLLSADLGARRSEILALRWSNIDLTHRQVRIAGTLDPIHGTPKARKSGNDQQVAITPVTATALTRWYKAMRKRASAVGLELVADPYVLSHALDGSAPWRPDYATRRFAKIRTAAKLADSKIRLYDLRHFVATQLLAAGIPAKTVAGRLGHSRVSTTTDIYGHVIPAADREAADVMAVRLAR